MTPPLEGIEGDITGGTASRKRESVIHEKCVTSVKTKSAHNPDNNGTPRKLEENLFTI